MQIGGQTLDDFRTPSLRRLPFQDVAADLPVEQDELPVNGYRGPDPRLSYAPLQPAKKLLITLGDNRAARS